MSRPPLPHLAFATPRKLPKASTLPGRVVVLDLAFASEASGGGFEGITEVLIKGLGDRLVAWVDHHDHARHSDYVGDPRFVLATKREHGACPEMVTPELVARVGPFETIVCHTDFDGLMSAAKWIREGREPYPDADADARAIDTRIGRPSPIGRMFDRAIRAQYRDFALFGLVVRALVSGLSDRGLLAPIEEAARGLEALEAESEAHARRFETIALNPGDSGATGSGNRRTMSFVDVTERTGRYDKTWLLLLGQERADIAMVIDRDTLTLAAPFDSGVNFLELLGLSGGMPTLVSVPSTRLNEVLRLLGAPPRD